jgi:hypothetical protein
MFSSSHTTRGQSFAQAIRGNTATAAASSFSDAVIFFETSMEIKSTRRYTSEDLASDPKCKEDSHMQLSTSRQSGRLCDMRFPYVGILKAWSSGT